LLDELDHAVEAEEGIGQQNPPISKLERDGLFCSQYVLFILIVIVILNG